MSNRSIRWYLTVAIAAFLVGRQSKSAFVRYVDRVYKSDRTQRPIGVRIENDDWIPNDKPHKIQEQKYWKWSIRVSIAALIFAALAAFFAGGAYFAAKDQAIQARRQVIIAESSFVESNRPIIAISFPENDVLGKYNEAASTVKIQADNIGAKPAFIFSLKAELSVGRVPPKKMERDDCRWNLGAKTIVSGGNLSVVCHAQTLNFQQANEIISGVSTLYVTGEIIYRFASGNIWKQYFCYYWFRGAEKNPPRMEVFADASRNFEERLDKPNLE